MSITYRPLAADWNQPTTPGRGYSPFRASWGTTVELLEREARQLGVLGPIVIQVDVREHDVRLDGEMRANFREPATPRVIVSFESRRHGPMRYCCDRYQRWRENVRAVALGLEALRKVERYGIATRGEQYRGWQALPPATAMPAPMTRAEAAEFLIEWGEVPTAETPASIRDLLDQGPYTDEIIAGYYRRAALQLHPDTGGDPALFHDLQRAREALQ